MSNETLGFIGLGVMGEPMCHNLHKKSGRKVMAYDIDPAPLERAREANMGVANSPQDIAKNCDIIFLSLPSGVQLEQVCHDLNPYLRAGQTIVDTTTAPVALTKSLAAEFKAKGVDYADAPIARTRQAARDGTLAVMVGAKSSVFKRIEPLIACYANDISLCGDVGSGQIVKILNNMIVAETVNAIGEALTIGRRAGLDDALLLDTLAKGSADSFVLRNHGVKAMLPGVFPLRAFSINYMIKDMKYAIDLAEETGVDVKGARTTNEVLEEGANGPLAEAYWPAMLAVIDPTIDAKTPDGD
ncbi:MAG: NAD(P)-dependent oxidoreductase [Alphaproteobacteria bacterium]|nr:NAD(P)-dependent oxidoreductase [Alphaproteobacteria bacterium]